jgi:hypothetical protein
MKTAEDLAEFERFVAHHREAVWEEVLAPVREARETHIGDLRGSWRDWDIKRRSAKYFGSGLRAQLPNHDPWHAWSNFEFIDDDGKANEVDALILGPSGLFLVEIKSRPGLVSGDAHTWIWKTDGREYSYDNPLILANRKAKRLASVLRKQGSVVKSKVRLPWIEPLIFLSVSGLDCKLTGNARARVYLRTSDDAGRSLSCTKSALASFRGVVLKPSTNDS